MRAPATRALTTPRQNFGIVIYFRRRHLQRARVSDFRPRTPFSSIEPRLRSFSRCRQESRAPTLRRCKFDLQIEVFLGLKPKGGKRATLVLAVGHPNLNFLDEVLSFSRPQGIKSSCKTTTHFFRARQTCQRNSMLSALTQAL